MRGPGIGFMIFLLVLALVLVVYYVGASTDFSAFSNGSRTILYALSGRTSAGTFAGYPGGASLPGGIVG